MTITGQLGSDTAEGGCTYLETPDGTRYELIFPPSLGQQTSPPMGATVTVRGELATDMRSICMIGPIFVVREIVATSDR